jgi:hypothetical protein
LAGFSTTNGSANAFFGNGAGSLNTTGSNNTLIGPLADFSATNTGDNNALLGSHGKVTANLTNAAAVGAYASVTQSHSLILGSINGVNNCIAAANCDSVKVGIGTTAPGFRLEVVDPGTAGLRVQSNTSGGTVASFGSNGDFAIDAPFLPAGRFVVKENGNVGVGVLTPLDSLDVNGLVRLRTLASGNTTTLCRNASNQISNCSSSIRYKDNVANLPSSLLLIKQLRPVTFTWKANQERDMGLIAEEVAKVEPLLTFRNDKGEIEGVKYDRLGVVLINVIKEQQAQIEAQGQQARQQAEQIKQQQQEIAALKKLVCLDHPEAEMCKP